MLICAALERSVNSLTYLLQHGANPNFVGDTEEGMGTALDALSCNPEHSPNSPSVCRILLEHGADPNICSFNFEGDKRCALTNAVFCSLAMNRYQEFYTRQSISLEPDEESLIDVFYQLEAATKLDCTNPAGRYVVDAILHSVCNANDYFEIQLDGWLDDIGAHVMKFFLARLISAGFLFDATNSKLLCLATKLRAEVKAVRDYFADESDTLMDILCSFLCHKSLEEKSFFKRKIDEDCRSYKKVKIH